MSAAGFRAAFWDALPGADHLLPPRAPLPPRGPTPPPGAVPARPKSPLLEREKLRLKSPALSIPLRRA